MPGRRPDPDGWAPRLEDGMDSRSDESKPLDLYLSAGTVTADGVIVGRRRRALLSVRRGWFVDLVFRRPLLRVAPGRPTEVTFRPTHSPDGRIVVVTLIQPTLRASDGLGGSSYGVIGQGWQIDLTGL
jgi:hypothetical protein